MIFFWYTRQSSGYGDLVSFFYKIFTSLIFNLEIVSNILPQNALCTSVTIFLVLLLMGWIKSLRHIYLFVWKDSVAVSS